MVEVYYTKAFLDSKNLGEMTAPNIFEFGYGWSGNGLKPYAIINLGYIEATDNLENNLPNKSVFKSLMVGGKLGIRPFAKNWESPFQPFVQVGAKTTFNVTMKVKDSEESEQLFGNGNTKIYDPVKITFLSGSVGFEYYIGKRTAINASGNFDYVIIADSKFNNYSASVGLRQYF